HRDQSRPGEGAPDQEDREDGDHRGDAVGADGAFVAESDGLEAGEVVHCPPAPDEPDHRECDDEQGNIEDQHHHATVSARPMISSSMPQIIPRISSRISAKPSDFLTSRRSAPTPRSAKGRRYSLKTRPGRGAMTSSRSPSSSAS